MNLKNYFFLLIGTISLSSLSAQPGMYSESDIEYQSLFMDAILAKQKGDHEEQISVLKEILKRDKSAHTIYYELSEVYQKTENFELAQKNAIKAVEIEPNNEWYNLRLAQIYELNNDYPNAVATYKKLILQEDENEVLYNRLVLNQLKNNQPDEALESLKSLQSKQGISEQTSRRIFDIHSKRGHESKAIATLKELSDEYPNNTRFLNNLAGYLHDIGKTDDAQNIFRKVLEIDPNNSQASLALVKEKVKTSEAPEYLRSLQSVMQNMNIPLDNKIQELMPHLSHMSKNGETSSALEDISETLVELYPTEAKAHAVRGDVLFYTGNFLQAEKEYDKAIKLDDRKFTLWDQWLITLWELEETDKLLTSSYNAIDLFPNQVNALIYHSLALAARNENADALYFLDEANLIAGKNELLKSKIQIAKLWIQSPQLSSSEVKSQLDKFNLKDESSPIFYELLGDTFQVIGDKNKSKNNWQKAIQLGGNETRLKKKIGA